MIHFLIIYLKLYKTYTYQPEYNKNIKQKLLLRAPSLFDWVQHYNRAGNDHTYQNCKWKNGKTRKFSCLELCDHKFVSSLRHVNAFKIWSMEKSVSLVYIQPKTALVIALALHRLKCKCKISMEKQLTDIGARKWKINI